MIVAFYVKMYYRLNKRFRAKTSSVGDGVVFAASDYWLVLCTVN